MNRPNKLENVALVLADVAPKESNLILDLVAALQGLENSASDEGCTDDLTVVDKKALKKVLKFIS